MGFQARGRARNEELETLSCCCWVVVGSSLWWWLVVLCGGGPLPITVLVSYEL